MSNKTTDDKDVIMCDKLILYYEDADMLDMLLRNLHDYLSSENAKKTGNQSVTIYSPADNSRTAYFIRNKSGTIIGKAWKTGGGDEYSRKNQRG